MIDWHKSMSQTYEFFKVDPNTWRDAEPINDVISCTINRDDSNQTLGSASIDVTNPLDECYVRAYLKVNQNGNKERFPLGTVLVQTPAVKFDGKNTNVSLDAYTPLIELKESMPTIGYSVLKDTPIMETVFMVCREKMRAPVVRANDATRLYDDFVANINDTWLTFLTDLAKQAKFTLSLDELGRVIFEPDKDDSSLQPMYEFNDGNSSILYPSITDERDLYGIPNVVEVYFSSEDAQLFSRVVNDDPDSVISTVNRGREIVYRETSPSISGTPSQEVLDAYAKQLLRNKSCLEHTITYTHGYCGVRVGDCVLLNYRRAGLRNVKAKIRSQSIKCETGCPVEETATYTTKLWR